MTTTREIKFRAWDSLNRRMRDWADKTSLESSRQLVEVLKDGTVRSYWPKDILMQYTGLKDKNGKEVYEGDVVSCTDYDQHNLDDQMPHLYEVRFFKGRILPSQMFVESSVFESGNEFEVIGNIYENPELLK